MAVCQPSKLIIGVRIPVGAFMKVSVLVSDVDSQGQILLTASALCSQNYPKDSYEIIIQDLGRYTREELTLLKEFEKQYSQFKVISSRGKNRAEMMNEAVSQSSGELLAFIESHCIAHPDWIRNYVELFRDRKIQATVASLNTVHTDSLIGKAQDDLFWKVREKMRENYSSGFHFDFHNSAMRRSCFDQLGGVNEKLPYGGEFELGARLHQNNMRIVSSENAVWHYNLNSPWDYFRVISGQGVDKTRMLFMHDKEFMQKYFPCSTFSSRLYYLKKFRMFFQGIAMLLVYMSCIGMFAAKRLNSPKLSGFFFQNFAENSRRYGMLNALKESA